MFKERNLQHLGCWNHLEKLAEMFLNTFHREHILLKFKIKKLLRKIRSKFSFTLKSVCVCVCVCGGGTFIFRHT